MIRFANDGALRRALTVMAIVPAVLFGCQSSATPQAQDETVRRGVLAALDSLFAAFESRQPERMLAAWAPGPHVWHVSDSAYDPSTLLERIRPGWAARRAFKVTWSLHDVRVLGPKAAVATTKIRFVATDTLGVTSTRDGYWTLVFEEQLGRWKIVADQRGMVIVPPHPAQQSAPVTR